MPASLTTIKAELPDAITAARKQPDADHTVLLLGQVEVIIHVKHDKGIEMVWMAVSALDTEKNVVNVRLRDLVFVVAERILGDAEWEWTAEWPTDRELRWFEVARLALKDINQS